MNDYLLADDLSGALEAGAAFRRQGRRVKLAWDAVNGPEAEDVFRVVSTESRNLPPARAAAVLRKVLSRQKADGGRLCFKKVDSTLRGPVGAELRILIEELAPPLVVLCPANPQAGRTIVDGILKVNGVPLAETDFRDDPIWPMKTSEVSELLIGQGVSVSARRLSLGDLRDKGDAFAAMIIEALKHPEEVLLSDAETQTDVETLVREVSAFTAGVVLVGSGAMASALATKTAVSAADSHYLRPELQPMLLLCGSRHPASRRQLEHLVGKIGGEVITVNADECDGSALVVEARQTLSKHKSAAVRFILKGGITSESAERIQTAIGRMAPELVTQCGPTALFLTGGETAWTVCRALQANALEILEELAPGVVLSRLIAQSGEGLLIVTKPGGFGHDALLTTLFASK